LTDLPHSNTQCYTDMPHCDL